jgi:hypothetical protein
MRANVWSHEVPQARPKTAQRTFVGLSLVFATAFNESMNQQSIL